MADDARTAESRNPRVLLLGADEGLAGQLTTMAATLRPRAEVTVWAEVGTVGDVLTDDGPFDVLVAGPELGTKAGMARVQIIHDELPALPIVLALTTRPAASLREVVRTGAIDLLQLPVSDDELRSSVRRGLQLSRQLRAAAPPPLAPVSAPATAAAPFGAPGQVITVASATGGCGKTFFATNLAYFLTRHTGKRACVVDLDLQFGEVSTALRLKPRYTIFDALQRDDADEADLKAHIEEYLVVHETGIHVLAAPKEPSEADRIDPPDVTRIIEAIRSRFDYVIVDTPPALSEVVLAAFDLSSALYVMTTLDLPSVRNMSLFLSTLEKLRVPTEDVKLVMNKEESDVGIDMAQVTALFPQGFEAVLPYDREVSKSINIGMPVMASSPGSEISMRLSAGMAHLLPEAVRATLTPPPAQRRSLFRRRGATPTTPTAPTAPTA